MKLSWPLTSSLPSVLMMTSTCPLKVKSEREAWKTWADPLISIGWVKAAPKPPIDGFAWMAVYCPRTWARTPASQSPASPLSVTEKAGSRSSKGSEMDGRVLKNSTPAVKFPRAKP